jgi:mycofactocin system glycosyltransferase
MSDVTRRFELDPSVRRRDRGRLLTGGDPPRMVRLSEAGGAALDAVLGGAGHDPVAAALADRLADAGIVHPLPTDGEDDPPLTSIVPVRDGGEPLAELVRVLGSEGPVIVVDDGSRDGSAERAAAAGARVIPNAGAPGPSGARNTGLRAAATELIAFVDADVVVEPGWRRGLADLLVADPALALVGPRVRSAPGGSLLARYERRASPLDLGPAPSRVGHRHRISYLPAAALLARRDALLELGGFDESMRFGEDVDLVWRLIASGRGARYVPSREVLHRPRPTACAIAAQRAGYGRSAPDLARRHGSAVAPLRPGRHAVAIWTAAAALGPRALLPGLAASMTLVASRGEDRHSRLALAEVALRGHVDATRHLARVLVREWLPLGVAAAAVSRDARRVLLGAIVLDSLPACSSAETPAELPRAVALHAVDRLAYGAGMWREIVRRREFSSLLPAGDGQSRRPR